MRLEELNLYALKYFFDSVELESMTEAASANNITRSAISQAITRLEEWAGASLITHEKRVVKLTSAGQAFYRNMRRSYDAFAQSITNEADDRSLSVGCSASLVETFLVPHLKKVKPLDKLNLVSGTTTELSRKLEEQTIHIAISIGAWKSSVQSQEKVLSSGRFVVASPTGKMTGQLITTEKRPEVTALKRVLSRNQTYLSVESWTLAAQIARELGCSVLIPDFLIGERLRRVDVRGFNSRYNVTVRHASLSRLSKSEIEFLSTLS